MQANQDIEITSDDLSDDSKISSLFFFEEQHPQFKRANLRSV
jgi:hypothetical protein